MNEQNSKPLYTLTVAEYVALSKRIFEQAAASLLEKRTDPNHEKEDCDIIFADEVRNLTGYTRPTLYSKVCRGEIPVLSRRKPLTFSRSQIVHWIKSGKPRPNGPNATPTDNQHHKR